MSETVKGRVQAINDRDTKDFYGICIDDQWYNGSGSLDKNLQDKLIEIKLDPGREFLDIRKINVIEEDSEDGAQSREQSNAGSGSGSSNSGGKTSSHTSMSERQASIQANSMTKTAAELVAEHRRIDEGEFTDRVSDIAHELNEISTNIREENLE